MDSTWSSRVDVKPDVVLDYNVNKTGVDSGYQLISYPLYKIRPFFYFFVMKGQSGLYLSQNLTVNEGICQFCQGMNFRVYIKSKPNKYGLKFYTLSDSKTGLCFEQ